MCQLARGEQLPTKWLFRELIEQELIDYLRVDICHSGGITEGKKIAAMGEVHLSGTCLPLHRKSRKHRCDAASEYVSSELCGTGVWGAHRLDERSYTERYADRGRLSLRNGFPGLRD